MSRKNNFIEKASRVHNNFYDYSLVDYINTDTKVKIICPIHGVFEQTPRIHLYKKGGCNACAVDRSKATNTKTTDSFINEAREVHGDKYDYSKTKYVNAHTPVTITCPIHGDFKQRPYVHVVHKSGCKKCAVRLTQNDFISKASLIHNDKYDYSLVKYASGKDKISIICPTHGEFEQCAESHLRGVGCPKCSGNIPYTTEEYVKKAQETHNNKYDYSLVVYTRAFDKITIVCPTHGKFEQLAYAHLQGIGCKECGVENRVKQRTKTLDQFVEEATIVHGSKYDYSLVDYINSSTKVKIICPTHGVFEQSPGSHLMGQKHQVLTQLLS